MSQLDLLLARVQALGHLPVESRSERGVYATWTCSKCRATVFIKAGVASGRALNERCVGE